MFQAKYGRPLTMDELEWLDWVGTSNEAGFTQMNLGEAQKFPCYE